MEETGMDVGCDRRVGRHLLLLNAVWLVLLASSLCGCVNYGMYAQYGSECFGWGLAGSDRQRRAAIESEIPSASRYYDYYMCMKLSHAYHTVSKDYFMRHPEESASVIREHMESRGLLAEMPLASGILEEMHRKHLYNVGADGRLLEVWLKAIDAMPDGREKKASRKCYGQVVETPW